MATTNTPVTEPHQQGDGVDISAPRARQAYPGKRILLILLASLAAVVVAFLLAYAFNPTNAVSGKNGNGATRDPAAAASFDTGPAPGVKPAS